MVFFENVWWLLVLIGVMILIHELGHYWAARFFDIRVETFSFGFGPRLFGFRKGETDFRFSAILFGGYVKMAGEQPADDTANDPRAFLAKPRWQRLIVVAAGPFMNVVLAVVLLAGLFMVHFPKLPTTHSPTVGYVAPDGPAAKAGIQEGDRIVQIDNTVNPDWEDIMMKEVSSARQPLHVTVERNGQRKTMVVTPVLDDKSGVGFAGWAEQTEIEIYSVQPGMEAAKAGLKKGDILLSVNGQPIRSTPKLHDIIDGGNGQPVDLVYSRNGQIHSMSIKPAKSNLDGQSRWMIGVQLQQRLEVVRLSLPDAVAESVRENVKSATLVYKFLQGIVERRMSPKSFEGPIRIAQISGEAAREGATEFFGLMSMVSLQLAIFNLLPIPVLDGGGILMLIVEMFIRRDLSLQVKENFFKLGFVFLMAFVVFVLYNDITKILPTG